MNIEGNAHQALYHHNQNNAMCLVDDLMEIFRPLVDLTVYKIWKTSLPNLTTENKNILCSLIHADLKYRGQISPTINCVARLVLSLVKSYEEQKVLLEYPDSILPSVIP